MGNTEGARLNRSMQKQVFYKLKTYPSAPQCIPRIPFTDQQTPPESTRYTMNPYKECVQGVADSRTTYQGGVSQEQIQALLNILSSKKNFPTESARLADRSCPGYVPAFNSIIPPVTQCPPLPPPPAPPMIPGVDPTQCR